LTNFVMDVGHMYRKGWLDLRDQKYDYCDAPRRAQDIPFTAMHAVE
jgi:hypothetical protein